MDSVTTDERFVLSDGARLWSAVSGRGIPTLFFNGGPGCDDYLEPVARLIDDRYRVVRFEPRGCGRSDWDGRYDVDAHQGILFTPSKERAGDPQRRDQQNRG